LFFCVENLNVVLCVLQFGSVLACDQSKCGSCNLLNKCLFLCLESIFKFFKFF